MEILRDENYFYTLYRDEKTDEHFLEVVCGTVAIFEIKIKLNEKELAEYRANPEDIRILAYKIMDSPSSYLERRV